MQCYCIKIYTDKGCTYKTSGWDNILCDLASVNCGIAVNSNHKNLKFKVR